MSTVAESKVARPSFLDLLSVEFAPTPERALAVTRIAAACSITVAIAMVFQIPQPPYMAYIVFLISRDEASATVQTAIGALVAVTLAILLNLGLSLIDTGEPALRLPAMAIATFIAMYSARIFALGPITYLAGFVLVLLQSLVDHIPSTEVLTRSTLWLWVVIFVPVATTALLNLLFGQRPSVLVHRTVRRVLGEIEGALASAPTRSQVARWREVTVPLLAKIPSEKGRHPAPYVSRAAVTRLLEAITILEVFPEVVTDTERSELMILMRDCRNALDLSGNKDRAPPAQRASLPEIPGKRSPNLVAFASSMGRFLERIEGEVPTGTSAPNEKRRLVVADALSNPAHWQFALKTTLAVMLVYCTYTLLDWPGLRTSIVTCFFVALGSLGETMHKLTLRIIGALVGGSLAGVCIVWVLPHLTDIGQLCILIALVSAAAGWIATSSERLSYAGLQIAFAFFLGVLQGYSPATDLTVLRDRVVGILLGNVAMTLIFSLIWPESAVTRARAATSEALRAMGQLLKGPPATDDARLRTLQALNQADHFSELIQFELRLLAGGIHGRPPKLPDVKRIAGAAFVATTEAFASLADGPAITQVGQWAEVAADRIAAARVLPDPPTWPIRPAPPASPKLAVTAMAAVDDLQREIEHAATV